MVVLLIECFASLHGNAFSLQRRARCKNKFNYDYTRENTTSLYLKVQRRPKLRDFFIYVKVHQEVVSEARARKYNFPLPQPLPQPRERIVVPSCLEAIKVFIIQQMQLHLRERAAIPCRQKRRPLDKWNDARFLIVNPNRDFFTPSPTLPRRILLNRISLAFNQQKFHFSILFFFSARLLQESSDIFHS